VIDQARWTPDGLRIPYRGRGDLGEVDVLGFSYRTYCHVSTRLLRRVCPVTKGQVRRPVISRAMMVFMISLVPP
jgi:hypothetical protein